MKSLFIFSFTFIQFFFVSAQNNFNYSVKLEPVSIPNLPGLHSFAFAQDNGKWLIIGGRKDGLHARQPFNSFPASSNNTDAFVIDINSSQLWTASLNSLPTGISEQLQSTNMNFYQDEDTLYLIGGYAYASSSNEHKTFENLTTVNISGLINAIVSGQAITSYFKQLTNPDFAICGGQLSKFNDEFYLVGGQRFDGRYNPMGHQTYTQTYSNQIRKFKLNNSGNQLSFSNYSSITDPIHLHRRDYNLVPQIMTDGKMGLLISSGVFQTNADLPYLYPVEISETGLNAITGFNQYLSNYHSANVALYDSSSRKMYSIFFGGMSQYYYQNGNLIQDNQVPFVNTISLLSRDDNGQYSEFKMQTEMPGLKGSSAEFIPNLSLPMYENEVFKIDEFPSDTVLLGHIMGGIESSGLNPFSVNQTNLTSADNTVYQVRLIKDNTTAIEKVISQRPFDVKIFPNPASSKINIEVIGKEFGEIDYMISNPKGQILEEGSFEKKSEKTGVFKVDTNFKKTCRAVIISVTVNKKYTYSEKIFLN